jgi:Predicted nucleotidyltransferases
MKSLQEIKKSLSDLKPELRKRYGVTEIGVFGSYVRGEQKSDSDVDVYVDYKEIPSLLDIVDLENYLSDELKEKVDLVPRECIRPELEKYILPEVVKI